MGKKTGNSRTPRPRGAQPHWPGYKSVDVSPYYSIHQISVSVVRYCAWEVASSQLISIPAYQLKTSSFSCLFLPTTMPTPPPSTSPRSTSKGFFSQSNRTSASQAKDVKAGVNPSSQSSSNPWHFRRDRGRQQRDMPPHTHDGIVRTRPSLVATKEVAVQAGPPSPPPSPRSRWSSLRSPTKGATSTSAAQPKNPPAVEPQEGQRLSRALHSAKHPPHSFAKKFPQAGNSRLRSRASSVDSWRVPFDQTQLSDRPSTTRTAPPPLDAHNLVVGNSTSFRTPGQDPSSSSLSSVLNPAPMSSALVKLASLEASRRGYISWRGTGSPNSTSMVPAFALAVPPPPVPKYVEPPRSSPTSSPPPPAWPPIPSISDSPSINNFETASSNASTLRSKRRGKRSKLYKDGKSPEATSSPTTSSSSG